MTLRFDLVARNADQTKANAEVQAKASKILSLLDEKKVAQGDVIAEELKSEPEYEDDEASPRRRGKIVGFIITRSFEAKIRDVTTFPKLVNELLDMGAQFTAIDGGLSKQKEIREEAGEKALINARESAEKALKATGMKVDSIFAVSPVPFPEIQERMLGAEGRGSSAAGAATTERMIEPDPLQYRLEPVSVTHSAHVIYLISPVR